MARVKRFFETAETIEPLEHGPSFKQVKASEVTMAVEQARGCDRRSRRTLNVVTSVLSVAGLWLTATGLARSAEGLCPEPVLQRLTTHSVQSGETVESLATDYGLLPLTLLALNPAIVSGLAPGSTVRIPPFNGAAVAVAAGQTWQDLAAAYGARADVLFEVNGCPATMPTQVFIPGVSWLLEGAATTADTATATPDPLSTYPLAGEGRIIANYGWQTDHDRGELVFSSGITLETLLGTAIAAAGRGTVAYVGTDAKLGTLIVINHSQGFQTRYAQVTAPTVNVGDSVQAGQRIAIATPHTDEASLLYFEVRTNSNVGWIARDPGDYLPALAVR